MATKRTSSVMVRRDSLNFTTVLASAVLEWLLIFLLFVNSLFSYLLTRFARYFKLQTPCLLCSRLDNVVGNEKPGFYLDLICGSHKSEISSLVLCHVHEKLADVHGMCEGCLFSFATDKKSNSETYRSLVGKLGSDLECNVGHDALPNEHILGSTSKKQCSCCNESWVSRINGHMLLQGKSIGPEVSELDIPLPASVEKSRLNIHDDLKRSGERKSSSVASSKVETRNFDLLSHVGYTELKITSESESEVQFSEDEYVSSLVHERDDLKEEIVGQSTSLNIHTAHDDLASVNMIHQTSMDQPSLLVPELQHVVEKSNDLIFSASAVVSLEKTLSDDMASVNMIHHTSKGQSSLLVSELQLDEEQSRDLIFSASAAVAIDNLVSANMIHHTSKDQPSFLVPELQQDVEKSHDLSVSTTTTADIEKVLSDDVASANMINLPSTNQPLFFPELHCDAEKSIDLLSPRSATAVGHGLEDLNWHHFEKKADPSTLPELIAVHDIPSSSDGNTLVSTLGETLYDCGSGEIGVASVVRRVEICQSESGLNTTTGFQKANHALVGAAPAMTNWHHGEKKADPSTSAEYFTLHDDPSSSNASNIIVNTSEETLDVCRSFEVGATSVNERGGICKSESGFNTVASSEKTDPTLIDTAPAMNNLIDLSDAYKLVIGNKGIQVSNMLADRFTSKDSARFSEDLKLLLSQISATRGLDFSLTEMSPRVQGHGEDLNGLQILQKRISLERNESGFESLDGSIVSEIEGESVVDRLKRQVDDDRKSMRALYRELEEERNASSVSANQAMAMITRLQEEKATLQMEALQYLRMMEEQAEYDVDALQKANELLAEKEKEIQALVTELEVYKKRSLCKSMLTSDEQSHVMCIGGPNANTPCKSPSCENSEGNTQHEKTKMVNGSKNASSMNDSLVDFEDERLYISQCLKKLEKKLHLFSNDGVHMPNGKYSENESKGVDYLEQLNWEASQGISKMEGDVFSVRKDSSLSRGSSHALFVDEEDYPLDSHRGGSIIIGETDLVAFENEVSDLNERLKALEADRNFLEHTINSLRAGEEGVQFIQEIAHHLRELNRIGIRREQAPL